MMGRFHTNTVLVTGGSGSYGQAAGLAFAKEGATVVLVGRSIAPLQQAVRTIGEAAAKAGHGGRVDYICADVTQERDTSRMVTETVARHGSLDIAFNSAGIVGAHATVADLDPATWQAVLDVNVTGTFLSMKHQIAYMRGHGGGVIVNTASNIGTHRRPPGLAAYAASKAAVDALTRTAAREHIADGVRINLISPGPSDTPMSYRPGETTRDRDTRARLNIPAGRVSEPREVAAAVLWLASAEANYIVGHDLVIDGGSTA
ncbi:SDR family oxidoreductase [Streptomyces sp. NPDC001941]|uniref:SDR family NAD(P)-dependent oxidoreductase n=1 Tax=Streptomyces sp. NPDC001941 TaxID=3154659 RepID=UPI00331B0CC1